jgi:streptogramin lyase
MDFPAPFIKSMTPSQPSFRAIAPQVRAVLFAALLCSAVRAQTGPSITQQPASQTVRPGTNLTLTVAVSGSGPFIYQWSFNGTNLPNDIITTVAGNGLKAFSGDGEPATNASLHGPNGVAVDASGELFIADSENARVRKVDVDGIISTIAGNGLSTPSGDGGAATNAGLVPRFLAFDPSGTLFVTSDVQIRKIGYSGNFVGKQWKENGNFL